MTSNRINFKNAIYRVIAALMSVVMILGITVVSVPIVKATGGSDGEIFIKPDYYNNEIGNAEYKPAENKFEVTGSKLNIEIPMTDIFTPFKNEIEMAGKNGLYPHGRDGKNKIAYVRYNITFPANTVFDSSQITMKNSTSMFDNNGMSYEISGNTIKFKFKLNDVNWQTIYDAYKRDIENPSSHTIKLTIPYSYS